MPYKNIDQKRAYQRAWIRKRRERFFANKSCFLCSDTIGLELHHVDPSKKVSHKIWSWTEEKRLKELTKCIVLCENCHKVESSKQKMVTHCQNGHLYTKENTGPHHGRRRCNTCNKEQQRKRRASGMAGSG